MARVRIATAAFGVDAGLRSLKACWKSSASGAVLILVTAGGVAQAQTAAGGIVALPEVVVSATPLPSSDGSGIEINKVPGDISVVPSKFFIQQYSPSVTTAITSHVPAAIALSVDGSDLSPDLFYRGFDASRISGTSAGLAVYENGVRINENFGDAVNLDLIPPIALASSEIYTNNPVFGLNALGGAINFITKNGFNFHGGDVTILGGSYGRANAFGEFGKQSGNYSFYFAGDVYRDGGYRPFGAQNAQRFLADLGYRSQDSETHLIGQFGRSLLGVQGVTPQVLVQQQYNSVFTTPQTTNNQAGQAQLLSRFDITPHWSIGSSFYVRQFDQFHTDGNDADVADCGDIDGQNGGTLCQQPLVGNQTSSQLQFRTANGGTIPSMGANTDAFPYGTTAVTSTHTTSFGTQIQATNKDKFFGHDNYFVVGGSVDTGNTSYTSRTLLGQLNSSFQDTLSGFPGAGTELNTASNVGVNSTFIHSSATYYGLFALDTFNITDKLAFTAGARANFANIAVQDVSGTDPELNSSHNYDRINPVVGATYTFSRALNVYAGYSEANRAPTPLESECADPNRPCVLETALVSDPAARPGRLAHDRGRRPRHLRHSARLRRRRADVQGRLLPDQHDQRHHQPAERHHRPGLFRQRARDASRGHGGRPELHQGRPDDVRQLRARRRDLPLQRALIIAEQSRRQQCRQHPGGLRRPHSRYSSQPRQGRLRVSRHAAPYHRRRCDGGRQPVLHHRRFQPEPEATILLFHQCPRELCPDRPRAGLRHHQQPDEQSLRDLRLVLRRWRYDGDQSQRHARQ